jgi:hypothetical protein
MLRDIFGGKGTAREELDQKEKLAKLSSNEANTASSNVSKETKVSKNRAIAALSIKPAKTRTNPTRTDGDGGDDSDDSKSGCGSEAEPIDILLQFIPDYGQGDPVNDSIVRSTLSALSVEDIDSQDEYGNTLLLLACQYRCEDLVRIMLSKGADATAVNSSGACCLHFACYRESASIGVARILLKSGADPDVAESTFGCTPLHYCAGTGEIEFCELLLSYGAQIGALDYYNYTCVDYAAEAGKTEVAAFLQKKLDAANIRFGAGNTTSSGAVGSPSVKGPPSSDMSNWESHVDPDSGGKYHIHVKTGECLWDAELKQRLQITHNSASRDGGDGDSNLHGRATSGAIGPKISEADLIRQALAARVVVFLSTHDPSRLVEVESLVSVFAGREHQLLKDLCEKYKVDAGVELQAFEKQLNELRPTHATSKSDRAKIADLSSVDPIALQEISREEQKRFETQLEEEKASYKESIGEKEGIIAKLKAQIESLDRGKNTTEVSIETLVPYASIIY